MNPEDKKGVFDRVSSFFKRKKSSSRQHSDASADASSPTSPQPKQEDGLKTPTSNSELTGLNYEPQTGADHGDTISQSSSPSASSVVSLVTGEAEFPFADSNSSGRSSVREVNVHRVSTAGGEKNSGNVTPTTLDPSTTTHLSADTNSEVSFSDLVVEEVSKRLQVNLEENILKNTEDRTVSPTTMTSFNTPLSISSPVEAPKSPNLTSISLASKKTFVKIGEAGHVTALTGVTLRPQLSTSQLKEDEDSVDTEKDNLTANRNAQIFTGENLATAWSCSPEREEIPRGNSPVQLHKAIWVETYLGEEEEGGREGEKETERMKQEEQDFRADSPPVLAVPVTVIPVDDSATQGTADSPSSPLQTLLSSGSLPESTISLAATTGEFQTTLPQPEEPDTGTDTKQGKRKLKDIRVTRKTVNLPSKQKVFAQRVYVNTEPGLDGNELTGEEYSTDSVLTISDKTVERLPNLQNSNVELKEANLEPLTTTEKATLSNTNTPEPLVTEKADSEASDFDDTALPPDMYKAKVQAGVRGQEPNQASKQGLKATAASGAKTPSTATGSKVKNVTTKAKSSREGTNLGTSSDVPIQREQSNEKAVSISPILKDPSTNSSISATSSKSKIPKRSTSDADVKSPVTPDKPSVTDGASSSKLQKQPRTKEPLKSPVTTTKTGRKPSFEDAKGGKLVSGDISPTKNTYKTGTKLIKEKSDENMDCATLVNGVEKEHGECSGKTGYPPASDAKKPQQNNLENNAPLASKTRLPISSPTKKRNDNTSTSYKKNVSGQTDVNRPKTSPEQQEVASEESPGSETPPPLSKSPKKGSLLSTRPSKHLSKRSISNEDSDSPTSCVSPPPTKQETTVSSRTSNTKQHQKSPVKDISDPLISVSKLPTRGQRSSEKLKSRKPQHVPTDISDKSKQDSNQNTNTETAVKASESTLASRVKDKPVSTEEEDKQPNTHEITFKAKEKNELDRISSATSKGISKIQSVQSSDGINTANAEVEVAPVLVPLPTNEFGKAIAAQSPVSDDWNAETDIQGRHNEGEQEAKLESSSPIQGDNSTQEQQTLLAPENSLDISEKTQIISNLKPDLFQEKETSVMSRDTTPGNDDVNDMSATPVVSDTIHSDIMTHFVKESEVPKKTTVKVTSKEVDPKYVLSAPSTGVSSECNLTKTDEQKQKEKSQTTNVIFGSDRLPSTLSIDSVKSKEDVGKKLPEALDSQTETVTVCKLPKNVENQLNKEALLPGGEFERQEKESKPTEKLNDDTVESSGKPSMSSCKEEPTTTEDEAEKEDTKPEEKCFQPDSENGRQTVVTDALEKRSTEGEQARNVLHETIAAVADNKHKCETLFERKGCQ
ncbi:altered inheritance of mitochondria protein 21-like isoform X2 [Anabas testudineus]|uniref:altered inheritance of mitochondria protein 21-like isoform X2 n=1 Tax=Anabas testudineus TaxID=64144 RepID=UPI000E4601F6|nr:altered inheritance of mitochondria protein 21-like isoform X2 [Anabas testudineus]